MSSIEAFKSQIAQGMMPTNRFAVFSGKIGPEAQYLTFDVSLPAENISHFQYAIPGIGPETKIPNRVLFDALVIQFYNKADNQPYKKIRDWQRSIYNDEYRFNDMSSYVEDIVVVEYDKADKVAGTHKFIKAYPAIVAPKTKNVAPSNTPEIFSVTFNYLTSEFS